MRRVGGQQGLTLIEVLAALVLMGMLLAGLAIFAQSQIRLHGARLAHHRAATEEAAIAWRLRTLLSRPVAGLPVARDEGGFSGRFDGLTMETQTAKPQMVLPDQLALQDTAAGLALSRNGRDARVILPGVRTRFAYLRPARAADPQQGRPAQTAAWVQTWEDPQSWPRAIRIEARRADQNHPVLDLTIALYPHWLKPEVPSR